MSHVSSEQGSDAATQRSTSSAERTNPAMSNLTRMSAWIRDRNIPFLVTSAGTIVMLLWAGS